MKKPPLQLNQADVADNSGNPKYAEPILGNPVSTLLESGVGNCFPGLEFDLRQLDVRFFPGLVFEFPGVTPSGPDGSQGARLVYADPAGDQLLASDDHHQPEWVRKLKLQLAGPEGAALGGGTWFLHWVEQDNNRIEMYDYTLYQNAAVRTPYEGETCWWIIRLIEADKPLTIALTQRDEDGAPTGNPVVLNGQRRHFLNGEGMIDPVYHPGELTSSMCSPWTHDFRDCACHYWASNHPDVALGEVDDPQQRLGNRTDSDDPIQAVNFVDWMRRRALPLKDVSAQTTLETARPDRYDPYEINLKWQQLDFVLQGQEMNETPDSALLSVSQPYKSISEMIEDLSGELAGLELTLALEYLYAYFSLRHPDDVTEQQEADWPGLSGDLRAARQLILSVALSEMTHLRWVNQVMWLIINAGLHDEPYVPCLTPAKEVADIDKSNPGKECKRPRSLRVATPETLQSFVDVERPDGALDSEYIRLVNYLRESSEPFPEGLLQLAVRIDSDGLQHYQKFRDVKRILEPYTENETVYLRPLVEAKPPYNDQVSEALDLIRNTIKSLGEAYKLEAALKDMPQANQHIKNARNDMHKLSDIAEELAANNIGVPFFAAFKE